MRAGTLLTSLVSGGLTNRLVLSIASGRDPLLENILILNHTRNNKIMSVKAWALGRSDLERQERLRWLDELNSDVLGLCELHGVGVCQSLLD